VNERQAVVGDSIVMTYPSAAGPVHVLRGANIHADRGEIVLVDGPSGSGKTTLLSILGGILTPASGRVTIEGTDLTQMLRPERARLRLARLGFVFQGFNLLRALTARENIELPLQALGIGRAERFKMIDALLERLGLADKGTRRPAQLSGGEQQRVAIARALAGSPVVVLADEPTASLDRENGAEVMKLLCELARERKTSVLIASHDQRIAPFADRIISLVDGWC
jgi:putative ABC transport system ATP-binding protein